MWRNLLSRKGLFTQILGVGLIVKATNLSFTLHLFQEKSGLFNYFFQRFDLLEANSIKSLVYATAH